MVDFEEEAKRILKSERERTAVDAKQTAGLAAWVFGLILILLLAWEVIRSIFFGAHFPWFSSIFLLAIYAFALVAGRIDMRLSTSRETRDSRLIRVELRLDRLLDVNERISEECKSVRKKIEELTDSLKEHGGEKEHISEELDERLAELRVQVKLARLFARIEDDLRDLRENVMTAQFAREGEKGFIAQEVLNSGRGFKFPDNEGGARSMAIMALGFIEEGLDSFETEYWEIVDIELSISRYMNLKSLHEEVREKASDSRSASLNEVCSSLSWIHARVNMIRESAAYSLLEKRAEQGDSSAQYELGIAYRDGQHGIQDYEEAYYWLCLATAANFATKDFGTEAVIGARDNAASHLAPADLSRVQGRVKKWIKDHFADLAQYPPARRAAEEILAGWEREDGTDETVQ